MQYALLVYSDQSSWEGIDEEEAARRRAESMPRWIALFEELGKVDPGALGRELEAATEAKVVRVVDESSSPPTITPAARAASANSRYCSYAAPRSASLILSQTPSSA